MHICRITLLLCQLKTTRHNKFSFLYIFSLNVIKLELKHVTQLLSLPDLPLSRVQGVKVVEQLSTNMKWDLCSIFFYLFLLLSRNFPSSVGSKTFCSSPGFLSLAFEFSILFEKMTFHTRPTTPQKETD